MRRTGHTLAAGSLLLTGTGFLILSGAGTAHAQPAAIPAICSELASAAKDFTALLKANNTKFVTDHAAYVAAVDKYGNQILTITSAGSPALRSAAKTYVTDNEAETAANDINGTKLKAEIGRMSVLACTPSGAPKTGGGSAAGLPDPALAGAGGAAALTGLIIVGLTLRNRSRVSAEHG